MQVIPVIDLLQGRVVHGRAGRRDEYLPLVTQITSNPTPANLARQLVVSWGLERIYVADLDGIVHREFQWPIYDALLDAGARLMLDAGIGDEATLARFVERYPQRVEFVVGLESLANRQELSRMVARVGSDPLVFSLDLLGGAPLTRIGEWQAVSTESIFSALDGAGFRRMIVLDLRQVGMGGGPGTLELIAAAHARYPTWELIGGGGVSHLAQIEQLRVAGCRGVLLASTLHDGRIGRVELAQIAGW